MRDDNAVHVFLCQKFIDSLCERQFVSDRKLRTPDVEDLLASDVGKIFDFRYGVRQNFNTDWFVAGTNTIIRKRKRAGTAARDGAASS